MINNLWQKDIDSDIVRENRWFWKTEPIAFMMLMHHKYGSFKWRPLEDKKKLMVLLGIKKPLSVDVNKWL